MSSILSERMNRFKETDLYVVITEKMCKGRPSTLVLEECLKAGVKIVQFREKEGEDKEKFYKAKMFREITNSYGALLIIDDRIDIALMVNADGVHLGQKDLPISEARRIAPELIIGASTHSVEQAIKAQEEGASYVNIGPLFPTQTKTGTAEPLGVDAIERTKPYLKVPFTCMGGIKLQNIEEVLKRGARHIAVVTAVTEADDIQGAVKSLREIILKYI
ncbi:MAG: thiamine phosphate synthase [Candidatus Hydrogenedentes bacterium]|nr:thiamine phosphate synthase [Candidatus Hydrogenedentota bacterium]